MKWRSQSWRIRVSLRAQLVALVITVVVVAGVSVGGLAIGRSRAALREVVLRQAVGLADLAASHSADYIANAQADSASLASEPAFVAAADRNEPGGLTARLHNWLALHRQIDGAFVFDLDGRTTASTTTPAVQPVS